MTTCREVQDLLPGYADARLAVDDLAIVRGHLAGCAGCADERAALERTDALLGAAFSDHPWGDAGVESLVLGLRARAQAQAARRPDRHDDRRPDRHDDRRGPGGGVWVAAAALLLTAGALLWPGSSTPVAPAATTSVALARAGAGLMRAEGEGAFASVDAGEVLRGGERLIAVAPGAHVRLDDGTRVELYPDTEVVLQADADGGVTVALGGLDGEVYCEVAPRQAPFRVAARGLDVQVLGTRFLVNHGRQVSRVVVLEGRVLASTHGDRRVLGLDDAAEAHEGEQALRTSRVTGPSWGLWVPRVNDELRRRFSAPDQQPASRPPAETSPLDELPPAPPPPSDLDTPIVPPAPHPPR